MLYGEINTYYLFNVIIFKIRNIEINTLKINRLYNHDDHNIR